MTLRRIDSGVVCDLHDEIEGAINYLKASLRQVDADDVRNEDPIVRLGMLKGAILSAINDLSLGQAHIWRNIP